jgi:hypothetical protein
MKPKRPGGIYRPGVCIHAHCSWSDKTFRRDGSPEFRRPPCGSGRDPRARGLNGSGKTTLLNILFGSAVIAATGGYAGEVFLDDRPAKLSSPANAIGCGIGMVHQEFALIDQ